MNLQLNMLLWLPLVLSIAAAFVNQKKATWILLGLTLCIAFFTKHIEAFALLSILLSFFIAHFSQTKIKNSKIKIIGWISIIVWCALLFLHFIAGFNNLLALDKVFSGENSTAFSMYLNLDKPLAFFTLLLAYPLVLGNKKQIQYKPALMSLLALILILPIASLTQAIKFELSLPSWLWLFAINNLMLTSVAEEALFRGFIQQTLAERFNWIVGLIIASLLFGSMHFAGGILLVIFATLAGAGYGLIFHYTNRLWCAVLAHFIFNLIHLIFFTYPLSI